MTTPSYHFQSHNAWAFLLDLDGTLVQTDHLHRSLWTEILASYGHAVDETIYEQRIAGRSDPAIWTEWNVGTKEERAQWTTWKESQFLQRISETVPVLGVKERIKEWIQAGHWIGIVTNSNKVIAEALLQHLDIFHLLDVWIHADHNYPPKPSPAPYLAALSELGVPRERCVIAEDSEVGRESARSTHPAHRIRIASYPVINDPEEITVKDFTDPRLSPSELCIFG